MNDNTPSSQEIADLQALEAEAAAREKAAADLRAQLAPGSQPDIMSIPVHQLTKEQLYFRQRQARLRFKSADMVFSLAEAALDAKLQRGLNKLSQATFAFGPRADYAINDILGIRDSAFNRLISDAVGLRG